MYCWLRGRKGDSRRRRYTTSMHRLFCYAAARGRLFTFPTVPIGRRPVEAALSTRQ
jgi:hypothetical protein